MKLRIPTFTSMNYQKYENVENVYKASLKIYLKTFDKILI